MFEEIMKYKTVIFDLDGTLLYTLEDLADSLNAALAALGFPPRPLDYFNTAVGDGAETMVLRCLPESERDADTLRRATERTLEEYHRRWNVKTRPYPGVPEMLDALTAAGVQKCILSNKPDASTQKVVAELLSHWNFDVVRGARSDTPVKPNPQSAIETAVQCGVAPADCLYVGDTDTDMRTAIAAGMFALGVTWGFRSADELRENGAAALVDHPLEIVDFIV